MATEVFDHGQVLYSAQGQLLWDEINPGGKPAEFTKLVVGVPNSQGKISTVNLGGDLPRDFALRLPKLTHLSIWGAENLESLPLLPSGLKCLDVRFCQRLSSLYELPKSLEILVLQDCANLEFGRGVATEFPSLIDCCISNSPKIAATWVKSMLTRARSLIRFEALHCTQLTSIDDLPESLRTLTLGGCRALAHVRCDLPTVLQRLDLRGTAIDELRALPASLDYIDLRDTKRLSELPRPAGSPSTIFLFGSGLRKPPSTEHGADENANVAPDTIRYFRELQSAGGGSARRCKVLLLGNGGAGKTCLSLALDPGTRTPDIKRRAKELGSTHGVQFWPLRHADLIEDGESGVGLHLWDFGGQEIYHNTHSLFMGRGAVFIVVVDPSGKVHATPRTKGRYQDEPRPLQYWIDFIRLAKEDARIAIVCSRGKRENAKVKQAILGTLRPKDRSLPFYVVDSLSRSGQLPEVKEWIAEQVDAVIEAEGSEVPLHWEIAQGLVERWVKAIEANGAARQHLTERQFATELDREVRRVLADRRAGARYDQLRSSLADGSLTFLGRAGPSDEGSETVRAVLKFLTHSGWVYWDPKLFEQRVIVGQRWALRGLYTLLDRRDDSEVDSFLRRNRGRFTLSDLGRLKHPTDGCWDDHYTKAEQKLLLSFLLRCQLAFELLPADRARAGEPVYVSFEHLPWSAGRSGRSGGKGPRVWTARSNRFHKLDWQRFLVHQGRTLGTRGSYERYRFEVRTSAGAIGIVRCELDPTGLGGIIEVSGVGKEESSLRGMLRREIDMVLHPLSMEWKFAEHGLGRTSGDPPSVRGVPERHEYVEQIEVFLSHAREPKPSSTERRPTLPYTKPVEEIRAWFDGTEFKIISCDPDLEDQEDIVRFMDYGVKRPKIIVLHSDRYWRRPDCMYELARSFEVNAKRKGRSNRTVMVPVAHPTSRIDDQRELEKVCAYWRSYRGSLPARLWNRAKFRDIIPWCVRQFSEMVSRKFNRDIPWSATALETIEQRLRADLPKLGTKSVDDALGDDEQLD